MVKLKTTEACNLSTTSGYCLWVPTYHSDPYTLSGGEGQENWGWNIITFASNDSADRPKNTGLPGEFFPGVLGEAFPAPGETGAPSDPAATLLGNGNSIVRDARTLSACMRMTYYGRLDRTSGQVAVLTGIPAEAVLTEFGAAGTTMSVDDLFELSTHCERLGIDTREVAWRPNSEIPNTFLDADDAAYRRPQADLQPVARMGQRAEDMQPTIIGFAWRGLSIANGETANLVFDFIKNIEWRPNPNRGLVQPPPRAVHDRSYVKEAIKYLDDTTPGWQARILSSVQSVGSRIAIAAATGYLSQYRRRGLLH